MWPLLLLWLCVCMHAALRHMKMITAADMVCILEKSRYDHSTRQNQIWAAISYGSRCRHLTRSNTSPLPEPPQPHLSPPHATYRKNGQQRMSGGGVRKLGSCCTHFVSWQYRSNTVSQQLRLSHCLLSRLMWNVRHTDARRRRARQAGNPGLQHRHVISMDVLFLLNCLLCER